MSYSVPLNFITASGATVCRVDESCWEEVQEICTKANIVFKNQHIGTLAMELFNTFHVATQRKHFTTEQRDSICKAQEHLCANKACKCEIKDNNFELDHITPISAGGSNNFDNLQMLCKACHKQKCADEVENGSYFMNTPLKSILHNETCDAINSRKTLKLIQYLIIKQVWILKDVAEIACYIQRKNFQFTVVSTTLFHLTEILNW